MSKYSESVGIWEHKLDGITHKIKPEEGDNLEFVRIKKEAEATKDEGIMLKGVSNLYFEMVLRSDKTLTEEEKKDLRVWINPARGAINFEIRAGPANRGLALKLWITSNRMPVSL